MTRILALVAGLLLAGPLAPAAEAPAAQPLAPDASIDQVLDALHARGQGLKDFVAAVTLAETDALTGDTTTMPGTVHLLDSGQGQQKLKVDFTEKRIGQRVDKTARLVYVLDQGVLTERDYKRKIEVLRRIARVDQKLNLLKLGEGPFPLPIGQERAEVLKQFEVKKIDPKQGDPEGTIHIQLAPREGTEFARKFKTLDVWVDPKSHFPRRIEWIDPRETSIRTAEFAEIRLNQGVDGRIFTLEAIPDDWRKVTETMD